MTVVVTNLRRLLRARISVTTQCKTATDKGAGNTLNGSYAAEVLERTCCGEPSDCGLVVVSMTMFQCCCPEKDREYDNVKTKGSVKSAPEKQAMEREAPGDGSDDSDDQDHTWIRSRSSDSTKQHVMLSPEEASAWQQKGTPPRPDRKRMATLESVEVDDLSQYPGPPQLTRTVSTTESSSSPTMPDSEPSHVASKSPRAPEPDELDAIVMAIQSRDHGHDSPRSARSVSQTQRDPSPMSRDAQPSPRYTLSTQRSPSPSPRHTPSPRRSPGSYNVSRALQSFPDSLSDVPSDVDPSTRDRYLTACRLLKSTLIERETALLPMERNFLQRLLEETEQNPTEEQLSAAETASATLLSDPLFQVESVNSSQFQQPNERESAKAAWQERSKEKNGSTSDYTSRISNRHTPVRQSMPALMDDDEAMTDAGASAVGTPSVARFDGRDFPFYILGVTPDFKVGVLTPSLMESLRSFMPYAVVEENFWLKYSLQRDGASLPTLLSKVRTSRHTVLGVETTDGYVFGAFCSSPWRVQSTWFGSGECFLWRLKRSRLHHANSSRRNFDNDNEMEVYPYTGKDDLIQYCTKKTIAVGGGDWSDGNMTPYPREPTGIGFMVDGDLMGGETNACATFANPRLGNRMISTNEFDIRSLEVWTVTPCTSIDQAEKLEMHKHFVEEQRKK